MRILPRSMSVGSTVLSLAVTTVLAAQMPKPDVKLGLWEITSATTMDGMPAMDTSKMTPQQQAQAQAMMSKMMGSRPPTVTKTCMTREKLDRLDVMTPEKGMACKQAVTASTASSFDANVTCTGTHETSGQMHIDVTSPTTFKATVKTTTTDQGRTTNVNIALSGKWVAEACGDVK